jgi:hypothetical protein
LEINVTLISNAISIELSLLSKISVLLFQDEVKRTEKYNKLKELLQEDKAKTDQEMWSKWVKSNQYCKMILIFRKAIETD